ncbi:hypothetical protein ACP70R_009366 [Stipagrostis hirtigluma subsp. patula]
MGLERRRLVLRSLSLAVTVVSVAAGGLTTAVDHRNDLGQTIGEAMANVEDFETRQLVVDDGKVVVVVDGDEAMLEGDVVPMTTMVSSLFEIKTKRSINKSGQLVDTNQLGDLFSQQSIAETSTTKEQDNITRLRPSNSNLNCKGNCNVGVHGESRRLYIVYLGDVKHGHPNDVIDSHHDILSIVLGSKEDSLASMVHNYKHGFSGFAAMLTEEQAKQLAEFPEVISIEPSRTHTTTTTRSWDFLGVNYQMPSELLHGSNYGEDIIIGVVDTGIWPESRSFSDKGYGPVPSRWRGVCQVGQGWDRNNCSRKIIGARFYTAGVDEEDIHKAEYLSPRDYDGHGTHTASTAAGSVVEAASFHGLATGAARGGAPRARIAVYKSLWTTADGRNAAGSTASVLAAIDDAIHDGVDVLSLSLSSAENLFGALHAVQKGITVVYSAGNSGHRPQTVGNTAPWVITVAASKVDRSFPTVITLGNKQQIVGQSLYYQGKNSSSSSFRSLAYRGQCTTDALNGTDLREKIVLCASPISTTTVEDVKDAGGSGLIFVQDTTDILSGTDCKGFPCVLLDTDTGKKIAKYFVAARSPVAKIDPTRTITGKETLAPKVAAFSSRGPSTEYADIIKPDIAAPGANILAAKGDSYEIMSGTSMAAPHVAGIVVLLKALHPKWSPAAIKSAIVTTEGSPRKIADPFDYGGGHINPNKAADPGLIYDIDPSDYNYFFSCNIKNTSSTCNATSVPGYHLNLPSISVPELRYPVTVSRKVTNVGEVDAVYHATIQSPPGVKMDVEPPVLVFNAANKVHTFHVKLSPMWKLQGDYTFGSLTWHSGQKTVRIPIAARITVYDFYADVA